MNILVADDNPDVLRLAARVLRKEGHEVTPVANGAELLSAWKNGRFDVVLSDIEMPGGLDGVQACMVVRRSAPGARLYLMTGDPSACGRAERCGLAIALHKPFSIDELAAWARSLIGP